MAMEGENDTHGSSHRPHTEDEDLSTRTDTIIGDTDELFCDVDDDKKPETRSPTQQQNPPFEYPSQDAKKEESPETLDIAGNTKTKAMPEDMNDLFCDVDDDDDTPKEESLPTPAATKSFDYPSQDAKKEDTAIEETQVIEDVNELFCDVDDEESHQSQTPETESQQPQAARVTTTTQDSSFQYPSREAKIVEPELKQKPVTNGKEARKAEGGASSETIHQSSAATGLTYDTLPENRKSRRHRQNRRNYDSDEDSDEATNEATNEARTTIGSSVYNSVGAVAVYRTGVVSQRPAVLTQAESQSINELERTLPLGNDCAMDEETFINATVTSVPVTSMSGSGKKNSPMGINKKFESEEDNAVDLPWYLRPFVWVIIALLIVALAAIVTVVVVAGSKDIVPDPLTSSPAISPDNVRVRAFEKYIGSIPVAPVQLEAYQWLITKDNIIQFSEIMNDEYIGIMRTRYILAVFYFSLGGTNWFRATGWLEGNLEHCQWQHIDCRVIGQGNLVPDTLFQPVTGLEIQQNNLQGSLPDELTQLTTLQYLLLDGNRLESVKAFENGLDSLRWLHLNENPLQDHEYIFTLTNLQSLHIANTGFSGTLPIEMMDLWNIRSLDLSGNNLQGSVNLASTQNHTHYTSLFNNMYNLQILDLEDNRLTGNLSAFLDCGGCGPTLERFRVKGNPIRGTIPSFIDSYPKLTTLSIAKSRITGTIPTEVGELTQLQILELYENYYFSESNNLPTELGNLHQLEYLIVSDSIIGGTIPQELANLSSLKVLGIARTSIVGQIPDEVCAIPSLEIIEHSSGVNCSCNVCVEIPV